MGLLGSAARLTGQIAASSLPGVSSGEFGGLIPNITRWRKTRKFITFNFSKSAWKKLRPLSAAYSAFMFAGPGKITVPIDLAEAAWSIFQRGG